MYETPSLQRSGAIMLLGLHSLILSIYLFEKEALDMLLLLQQHCDTSSWTLLFFAPQSESSLLQNATTALDLSVPTPTRSLWPSAALTINILVSGVIFYNLPTEFHQWHKKDFNFYLLGGTGRQGWEGAQYCSQCLLLLCCYWFLMGDDFNTADSRFFLRIENVFSHLLRNTFFRGNLYVALIKAPGNRLNGRHPKSKWVYMVALNIPSKIKRHGPHWHHLAGLFYQLEDILFL